MPTSPSLVPPRAVHVLVDAAKVLAAVALLLKRLIERQDRLSDGQGRTSLLCSPARQAHFRY